MPCQLIKRENFSPCLLAATEEASTLVRPPSASPPYVNKRVSNFKGEENSAKHGLPTGAGAGRTTARRDREASKNASRKDCIENERMVFWCKYELGGDGMDGDSFDMARLPYIR